MGAAPFVCRQMFCMNNSRTNVRMRNIQFWKYWYKVYRFGASGR